MNFSRQPSAEIVSTLTTTKKQFTADLRDFKMNISKTLNSQSLLKFNDTSKDGSRLRNNKVAKRLFRHKRSKNAKHLSTPCIPVRVTTDIHYTMNSHHGQSSRASSSSSAGSSCHSDEGGNDRESCKLGKNGETDDEESESFRPAFAKLAHIDKTTGTKNEVNRLRDVKSLVKSKYSSPFLLRRPKAAEPMESPGDTEKQLVHSEAESSQSESIDKQAEPRAQSQGLDNALGTSTQSQASGSPNMNISPSSASLSNGEDKSSCFSSSSSTITNHTDSGLSSINSAQLFYAELRECLNNIKSSAPSRLDLDEAKRITCHLSTGVNRFSATAADLPSKSCVNILLNMDECGNSIFHLAAKFGNMHVLR